MKKKSAPSQNYMPHILVLGGTLLISLSLVTALSRGSSLQRVQSASATAGGDPITKKAMVVIYDPVMPDGRKLTAYKGWNNPASLNQQALQFFPQNTDGKINYVITETREIDGFPIKSDGFTYTPQQYADMINGTTQAHNPDGVNYYAILNDTSLDICGKLNRNEIDELWLWGGPWFGYNESALATSPTGPQGFDYNGPVLDQSTCNRLMPIMGFNYERGIGEMIHDWGHRTEATMSHVYRGWEENRTSHNWDKFALAQGQSPNYAFSGCGSVHWPPNGLSDYDYGNVRTSQTACDDFYNYPNLSEMSSVTKPVTCADWGCTQEGYMGWWLKHIPHFVGVGPDGVLNDWWVYIMDPNMAVITEMPGTFSNFTSNLRPDKATFTFSYSGSTNGYRVDLSTFADFSSDVYLTFGYGALLPITVDNPQTRWDKYTCGRSLYWRVYSENRQVMSPIQTAIVDCSVATTAPTATPLPTPTASPTPMRTATPKPTAALTLPPITPAPLSYTFLPIADTYTRQQRASTNFGREQSLFVHKTSEGAGEQRAYLRFNVTKVPRFVSAKLRLYVTEGSTNAPILYKADNSWNETSMRWNNQPSLGSEIGNVGSVTSNSWLEYNVTSAVKSNTNYGFALAGERNVTDGVTLSAREGLRPAELVVTTK